jgi:hypothetical protein
MDAGNVTTEATMPAEITILTPTTVTTDVNISTQSTQSTCGHNSIRLTTKCCKKKICWLCYNESPAARRNNNCHECGVKICMTGCKPRDVMGSDCWVEVCESCSRRGIEKGYYQEKKNVNDFEI